MRARRFISVGAVISLTLLALPRAAIAQGASRADIQGVIIRQGSFQRYKANALDNASFDIMSQYVHAEDTTGTPGRPDIIWLQFRWADYEQANNHWDATIEGNIRAAAKAACTNGFDIGLTIRAGADAPIGRPGVAGYPRRRRFRDDVGDGEDPRSRELHGHDLSPRQQERSEPACAGSACRAGYRRLL
jgi:hypothetical protein